MMNQIRIQRKVKKSYMNFILTAFILLICVVISVLQNEAKKQNEVLMSDFLLYQQADSLLKDGKIDEVLPPLEELHTKYNNDYNISNRLGYVYFNVEKIDTALILYNKTLDLNPYLVENKDFMYQYAIVLANNYQYDNAFLVIDRLLRLPMDEDFKAAVIELKDTINGMKGSTK